MPALLAAPWFIPLLTAAGVGTAAGTGIYDAVQASGAGAPSTTTDPAAAAALAAQQKLAQQKAAFVNSQNTPVAPTGTSGLTDPTTAAPTPSPEELAALMKLIQPGGSTGQISGGVGQALALPGAGTSGLSTLGAS